MAQQSNCVKVSHILKIDNVNRHVDTILHQIIKRVGNIKRCIIFQHARTPPNTQDQDTVGFIQLVNENKLAELAYMVNNYDFHGKYLKAQLVQFRFDSMDEEYLPKTTKCGQCEAYTQQLAVYEHNLKMRAIQGEISKFTIDKVRRQQDREAGMKVRDIFRKSMTTITTTTVPTTSTIDEKTSMVLTTIGVNNKNNNNMIMPLTMSSTGIDESRTGLNEANRQRKIDSRKTECDGYEYVSTPTSSESSIIVVPNKWQEPDGKNQVVCCVCGQFKSGCIRPVFRKPEVQTFLCSHAYCKECFNAIVVVNFMTSEWEWDGYAMVASFYRFKHSADVVFSCQMCRMNV
jgi:hypothetical protein